MIDLDALEKLAKAATPGPWDKYPTTKYSLDIVTYDEHGEEAETICEVMGDKDHEYIAAANPQTILALCRELRAAREVVDKAKAVLSDSSAIVRGAVLVSHGEMDGLFDAVNDYDAARGQA